MDWTNSEPRVEPDGFASMDAKITILRSQLNTIAKIQSHLKTMAEGKDMGVKRFLRQKGTQEKVEQARAELHNSILQSEIVAAQIEIDAAVLCSLDVDIAPEMSISNRLENVLEKLLGLPRTASSKRSHSAAQAVQTLADRVERTQVDLTQLLDRASQEAEMSTTPLTPSDTPLSRSLPSQSANPFDEPSAYTPSQPKQQKHTAHSNPFGEESDMPPVTYLDGDGEEAAGDTQRQLQMRDELFFRQQQLEESQRLERELQELPQAVNEMWQYTQDHQTKLETMHQNVESAAENSRVAVAQLAKASKSANKRRAVMLGAGVGAVGGVIGGPAGVAAGATLGAAAVGAGIGIATGGVIGFGTGHLLKKKGNRAADTIAEDTKRPARHRANSAEEYFS